MWTNAQIKFLYYPLILPHLHIGEGGRGSKYVKSHDLNWGKIHLNKKGIYLFKYTREISRVFNWQLKNNSSRIFEECISDVSFDAEQLSFCDKLWNLYAMIT